MGCWFSIGSAMLASRSGRTAADAMPIDRVLPETDGPFGMTEGRPLDPGSAGSVYIDYAKLKGMSASEVEAVMTSNFRNIVKPHLPA
jgi:TatD DNase family protein